MAKYKNLHHLIELNLAIVFMSTSGSLGRYIDVPVPIIIALRAVFGGIVIFLFCKLKNFNFKIDKSDRRNIFLGGFLLGMHWISYFYALKLSNVAIGMISIYTFPVITAFLEPLILKTKFQKTHILLGVLLLLGVYFLVPDFSFQNDYTKGMALGVFSAFCFALRNIIMKSKVKTYNGSVLMLFQLIVVGVCLSPFILFLDSSGITAQLPSILLLALLTTAIGHTMFLYSFRHFSTTSASIISSSQPIYGIIIAMIFLKEYPELSAVFGGALILISIIIESRRVS